MSVKVGITSRPGSASSTKVTSPPILPSVPLYILYIIKEANGAQITSLNSPIPGITNDNIPTRSKKTPAINKVYLFFISNLKLFNPN